MKKKKKIELLTKIGGRTIYDHKRLEGDIHSMYPFKLTKGSEFNIFCKINQNLIYVYN